MVSIAGILTHSDTYVRLHRASLIQIGTPWRNYKHFIARGIVDERWRRMLITMTETGSAVIQCIRPGTLLTPITIPDNRTVGEEL